MLSRVLMGLWFLLYGLAHFIPNANLGIVLAVLALVVGIVILAGQ